MNLQPTRNLHGALSGGGLGIALLLTGAALLRPVVLPSRQFESMSQISEADREAVNTTPFAQILGEVRATAADLMWIKTERYLHRGVAYTPHIDADAMAHQGEVAVKVHEPQPEHDHGHAVEHDDERTLIPEAEHDYRGFIGTLQRAIEPWQGPDQPHAHEAGAELLPWYRLLTLSDPHHWRGYVIGSWWLLQEGRKNPAALGEAEDFITEGIANNPECFQLPLMQCRIRMERNAYEAALLSARQAVKAGLKKRPAAGNTTAAWLDADEEDFRAAVRYIPMLEWRKLNRPAAARLSIEAALALLPNDAPLKNMLNALPH